MSYPTSNPSSSFTSLSALTPTPITGLSVFWPLFTLALASCLHPLGSVSMFPLISPKYRYYMRILPLSGLLDSMLFLQHCVKQGALAAVISRLRENEPQAIIRPSQSPDNSQRLRLDEGEGLIDGSPDAEASKRFLDSAFDVRARAFPNAFVLLAYAKMCTYAGIPWSLSLGTIYFVSWLVLEVVVVAQHFSRRRAGGQELRKMFEIAISRISDGRKWRHSDVVVQLGRFAIAGQILALLVMGISSLGRQRSQTTSTPQTPSRYPALPFWKWSWWFTPTRVLWSFSEAVCHLLEDGLDNIGGPAPHDVTVINVSLILLYILLVALPTIHLLILFVFAVATANILPLFMALAGIIWCTFTAVSYLPFGLAVPYQSHILRAVHRGFYHPRSFVLLSFLLLSGSLFYYIKLFDPTGTSKRAWSEVLG